MWLLVIHLMLIYNKKEQVGQREIQALQFEKKRSTRKCKFSAQKDKNFQEKLSEIKAAVTSEQEQADLPTCENKEKLKQ